MIIVTYNGRVEGKSYNFEIHLVNNKKKDIVQLNVLNVHNFIAPISSTMGI